ncbi:IclR family transcriptional regulator C-terminal domain-containing protein [Kitasatospora sp. NPDC028055]|uniref:IclR family transcriptional regulator n=1 Tax=Kitasatospora sp. NPDC028055 TaxID=3155653 RepID=UPI0033DD5DA5
MAGQTGPRAADRTLEVLELVAGSPSPVPAKALARSLGCALSTAYTLLAPLTERGYLVRTDGGYALGYQVSALHRAFQRQMGLTDSIDGVLARMRHATRASANYVAYQGDGLVIADVRTVAADGDQRPDLTVGVDPRSHAYAHGKIALAAAGPAARRRYLEQPGLRRFTPHTIASVERLDEELRRIRRTGVALDVEEARPGLACLAAPVLGTDGSVIGSVSLAVRPEELRARRHQLIAAVKQAAQAAAPIHRP